MNRKRVLALFLIITSAVVGVIAFWLTYRYDLPPNTTIVMIYLSAAFTGALGSVLLFSTLLDSYVVPVIDEFVEDATDDYEDLKSGKFTFVHKCGIILIITTIGFAVLTILFSKFSATWGGIPVVIPTVIVMGITTWILTQSKWFYSKTGRTPQIIFIILLIGLVLSPSLGIPNTENLSRAVATPVGEYQYDRQIEQALMASTDTGMNIIDFSFGFVSDCDGDECLWMVVIAIVVVIAAILVTGSAYITHFWFFSGCIFLCGMWIIFIRELRVRPEKRSTTTRKKYGRR